MLRREREQIIKKVLLVEVLCAPVRLDRTEVYEDLSAFRGVGADPSPVTGPVDIKNCRRNLISTTEQALVPYP